MPSFAVAALSLPPATLALASALFADVVRALKVTAPPASTLRAVVAFALSTATVSASEMPTPVSPDLVSPLAVVSTEPSCAALAVSAPSIFSPLASVPISASVWLSDTEMATTGVTAVAPAAPPSACVVM